MRFQISAKFQLIYRRKPNKNPEVGNNEIVALTPAFSCIMLMTQLVKIFLLADITESMVQGYEENVMGKKRQCH